MLFKNSLRKGYAWNSHDQRNPLKINDETAVGLEVDLPDSPPLLMIIGRTGFVMCGFLSVDVAERLNVAAAVVSGVKNLQDALEAEIRAVTSKAQTRGVKLGMKGKDAVRLLL